MRCAPGSIRPSPVLSGLRAAIALALLPSLLVAIGCKAIEPLNPEPIEVASSGDRTEGAIRDALRRDQWRVETWVSGEIYAATTIEGQPLRIRIVLDDGELRIRWIDDGSLDGTVEEVTERKRQIRRALRNLAERIKYHIESADFQARSDPGHPAMPQLVVSDLPPAP
jgi:hypothetical protein